MSRFTRRPCLVGLVAGVVTLLTVAPAGATEHRPPKDCSVRSVGHTALVDLGTDSYQGEQGGLYPGGTNDLPADHLATGLAMAAEVQPRDALGQPDPNGSIGLIAIGQSNTKQEFNRFMDRFAITAYVNPALVPVNGAQGTMTVDFWADPNSQAWVTADVAVTDAGLTPAQVQVAWVKLVRVPPPQGFPDEIQSYADALKTALRNLKLRYPNVQLAYLSDTPYGGYAQILTPEPAAYQQAFGIKWVIADQIAGDPELTPGTEAPWIAWGPYLWADGLGTDLVAGGVAGRADGLEWLCSNFTWDGVHLVYSGHVKVVRALFGHFETHPTSRLWFCFDGGCNRPSSTAGSSGSSVVSGPSQGVHAAVMDSPA